MVFPAENGCDGSFPLLQRALEIAFVRSRGQRILSASVFAFFAVASDDFAIGFPVIDALYVDLDMGIYITGNAF